MVWGGGNIGETQTDKWGRVFLKRRLDEDLW